MVRKAKEKIVKKYEEEYQNITETLYENEVNANLFVSHILIISAFIALIFIVLDLFGVFRGSGIKMTAVMAETAVSALVAAGVSEYFKGRKKWIKYFLMFTYVAIYSRTEMVLGHNVYLLALFPIIVSVRYYSQNLTIGVSIFTLIGSFLASYLGTYRGMGVYDLNFASLYTGSALQIESGIKDAIRIADALDIHATWRNLMLGNFLPRYVLISMASILCGKIAYKGREMIFSQQAETKKSERISTELGLASSIQANMLPNIFPAFPDRKDFDIYATMTPAKEVGGDFYDFFMIDNDHLAIVIADVSGKGIPAAMFMVIAKTLIKDHTQLGLSPAEVFTKVNDLLCEGNEAGLFVTAWMGIMDLQEKKLTYVNAGHNPPILMKNGILSFLHCKPGFVLAGFEGYKYKQAELELHEGDKIFLYTDGVTEASNASKELYGEERLMKVLETIDRNAGCANALHKVRADIDKFVGDAEQFDDLTMLAFDFSHKKNETLERSFDANDKCLHDVLAFVEQGLEEHDADMKATMAVTVSLEELFVNICHYAYPEDKGKVIIGMNFNEDKITVYLVDSGIPFNPLENKDPDVSAKLEDRQIGGLGIFMVKKSMDECYYERKGNQNRFIMTRKIKG